MNIVRAAIIALVVVWLQVATLPALGLAGVVPNLALVCVILLAARLPVTASLGLAVAIGALLDASSGSDYGLRTAFYVLIALITAVLGQLGSDLDNLSLLASLVIGATLMINLAILANLAFLHISLPLNYIGRHVLVEICLNLIMLVPLKWAMSRAIGRSAPEYVINPKIRRG
ncbi:MAG TPA: rod shape-determining protein MreD [Candidatus Saccharimonadales bacterium]|nr:rod shape-determining protein MreD [Candidatus Saccharimonadales bacterium]